MLLAGLIERRQMELAHPLQRERLIVAMTTLKKSMPLLSTALQTYCKYPSNEQAMVRILQGSENSGTLGPNPHWTRARKFAGSSFDVACIQCEHSHSQQQVPFACVCAQVWIGP